MKKDRKFASVVLNLTEEQEKKIRDYAFYHYIAINTIHQKLSKQKGLDTRAETELRKFIDKCLVWLSEEGLYDKVHINSFVNECKFIRKKIISEERYIKPLSDIKYLTINSDDVRVEDGCMVIANFDFSICHEEFKILELPLTYYINISVSSREIRMSFFNYQ